MQLPLSHLRLLRLLTISWIWLTLLLAIAALVAPVLFSTLSKQLAGNVAGQLFQIEAWVSVVLATGLTCWVLRHRLCESWRRLVVLLMGILLCTLCGYFVLQPAIAALRVLREAQPENLTLTQRFAWMHGLSTAFYWLKVMLLSVFIWRVWRSFSKTEVSQTVQRMF